MEGGREARGNDCKPPDCFSGTRVTTRVQRARRGRLDSE